MDTLIRDICRDATVYGDLVLSIEENRDRVTGELTALDIYAGPHLLACHEVSDPVVACETAEAVRVAWAQACAPVGDDIGYLADFRVHL